MNVIFPAFEGRTTPPTRVSLTAEFLSDLVEVLERHGHAPVSGASTVGALGYNAAEVTALVRAVAATPTEGDAA